MVTNIRNTDAETFFSQELSQLQREIDRLQRAVDAYRPDDPRASGQRAILQQQRQNEQIVRELTEYAHDPVQALLECRIQYGKARQAHARSRHDSARTDLQSDTWWNTRYREQYLGDLSRRYETWLQARRDDY